MAWIGWAYGFVALVLVAGCMAPSVDDDPLVDRAAVPPSKSFIAAKQGPFVEPLVLARGEAGEFPSGQGAHEPILAADSQGRLFLRYVGCSDGTPWKIAGDAHWDNGTILDSCVHRPVLRSVDGGQTWSTLNDAKGRLSLEAPTSHPRSPVDIAIDASDIVYALEGSCREATSDRLGCKVEEVILQRSDDAGETWTYLGNLLPAGTRRPTELWLAAGSAGHVLVAWRQGYLEPNHPAGVGVRTSFDGGRTFTDVTYLQTHLQVMGKPVFESDGKHAYVPYLVDLPYPVDLSALSDMIGPVLPPRGELRVGVTEDGGRSWTERSTGLIVTGGVRTSECLAGPPAIASTKGGGIVYAFAETITGSSDAFTVKIVESPDRGRTWGTPIAASTAPSSILPWLSTPNEDQLVLSYVRHNMPVGVGNHAGVAGAWDVYATIYDGAGAADVLVEAGVHQDRGPLYFESPLPWPLLTGPLINETNDGVGGRDYDRSLSARISHTLLPDGRLAVAYVADPQEGGSIQEIHFAIQER